MLFFLMPNKQRQCTEDKIKGRLHQPHLNRHLANGHLTLSSH